jgi:hypothetical protein
MFKPCSPDKDLVGGEGIGEYGRFVVGGGSSCPLDGSVKEDFRGNGSFLIGIGLLNVSLKSRHMV